MTIDALSGSTTNTYDAAGNLTQTEDADGNVTTFSYDADERQITNTDPFGHTTTNAYNAVGLLTDTTDRLGRQIQYLYDADNRVTGQTWVASDGTTVDQRLTFTYDNDGNQLTAQSSSGTYTMSYDGLGRVTGVQEPFGQQLTFSYDARGNRTVVQDSQDGVTTSVYDDNNQLVELEQSESGSAPLRVNLTYNQLGQNDSITRYNSLDGLVTEVVATTSLSYDVYGRETNIDHTDGTPTSITYTYDAQGWVNTETRDSTTVTYTYDADGELTGDGATTVTYDADGNRDNGSNTPGTANQLTTDGTWDYSYDLEGNETKKVNVSTGETWTYGYDQRNELLWAKDRVTDGGTLISRTSYKYDAYGNRIEQDIDTNGDGTVDIEQRYALDGWNPALAGSTGNSNWNVWADLDGLNSNALVSKYLRGDVVDQLFARVDDVSSTLTPYWMLTDHLGSVIAVTDDSGAVQASVHYDGWGKATITGSNTAAVGRYEWTGREYDAETKLQYNRARYYDAATGRWMSQDPLGFDAGDSNLYRYASNKPTTLTDPSGLLWTPRNTWENHLTGATKKKWEKLWDHDWRIVGNNGKKFGSFAFGPAVEDVRTTFDEEDMKKGMIKGRDIQWYRGYYVGGSYGWLVDFDKMTIQIDAVTDEYAAEVLNELIPRLADGEQKSGKKYEYHIDLYSGKKVNDAPARSMGHAIRSRHSRQRLPTAGCPLFVEPEPTSR